MSGSYYFNSKPKVKLEDTILLQRDSDKINPLLFDLLTIPSPHGTEKPIADIIVSFVSKNLSDKQYKIIPDEVGNIIIRVGKPNNLMFSSHMDTVHRSNKKLLNLHLTEDNYVYASTSDVAKVYFNDDDEQVTPLEIEQEAKKHGASYDHYTMLEDKLYGSDNEFDNWADLNMTYKSKSVLANTHSVLGADDKLGCYIMCRMIAKKIAGLYVFHVGEECGGIGSSHLADKCPEMFKDIDYCVAFDRKGYNDVIFKQGGTQCCSDDYAKTLSSEMNKFLPPQEKAEPSPNGSFTDSANYTDLIAECTNMPVGYFDQHSSEEHFDLEWLEQYAIPAYTGIDWTSLPVARDPNYKPVSRFNYNRASYSRGYGNGYGYGSWQQDALFDEEDYTYDNYKPISSSRRPTKRNKNQSTLDKINSLIHDKLDTFDVDEGFQSEESHGQRVQRVLYSFIASGLTLEEIAELIVDVYENKEGSHYDW